MAILGYFDSVALQGEPGGYFFIYKNVPGEFGRKGIFW